ncbi:MAG: bifunctional acetaldehyde-CoA/alcohol dehydrogenase [Lactobacillus sp.]|jgi:acetaldehyde dehydrogenase/alcohol dehydrogenase|nr:bifunctional acetaldehyde-CoA/alcohol dehydrogenase [Lactobacillus sp.]MCI1916723.1 bifunctional acetaldehyde-CoA/alcohol dehydrogenase [Lactobacillus sp.]MCI1941362.1 bifunctional acetaldehyde-CoA/alcohol dehydrogenase [Lactobacillus sp.]MCI1971907.1 bifunctional acetaldehyde-CoA/alcohol dehydrogenase [Lactobacillus sp.]MCI2016586.1 bifunctional acetaldehyde-CoA/alcohol dehydrogenase [Lactobacillus sp.]
MLKDKPETQTDIEANIDQLVANAQEALKVLKTYDQEKIDQIVHRMAIAGLDHHMELAKMAVEETGRGVYEDKAIKNMFATEEIWHSIKDDKTVGVISEDKQKNIVQIAEPIGVIAGVTPVTNPTSTVMFKSEIAIKTRNPIIFSFHPGAQKSSARALEVIRDEAKKVGLPDGALQFIAIPSIEACQALMHHPDIATILATGGPGMVKSAYSSGKPALGVGAGNAPAYIEATANIKQAVNDIVLSKSFDNGMVCASEQGAVVDAAIYDDVKKEFTAQGAYFVKQKDIKKLTETVINTDKMAVNPRIVGQSAWQIANWAGIDVPKDTPLLIAELKGVGDKFPLSHEKLSPVLAMFKASGHEEAFEMAETMLDIGGLGHTAIIHTADDDLALDYADKMQACRVLVNSPSTFGGIGDLYNEMIPSLTLGCGSYGGNSISHNVGTIDLLNIKTLAKRRNNMQWVKLPPKIYFERNSVRYLEKMDSLDRVLIVGDRSMEKLGYVRIVEDVLKNRTNNVDIQTFLDVEPDPSSNTVYKGTAIAKDFKPDAIVAIGGGSVMDAAKGIWLFYDGDGDFFGAKQKFLDIRKRTYKFPKPTKSKLVCIPTTSGTGSEVTPFAVITDSDTGIKYPLADYALTPDVALVDPQFIETVPPKVVADTGLDVICHATESFVSTMASSYTKGLSLQALKLAFDNLELSYQGDLDAKAKMHDASTIAGMAFANALLGINHSIAHKLGQTFHLPHGRCIAITFPHVVRYNAKTPKKRAVWSKYNYFRADEDYAEIARYLGLKGNTTAELVEAFAQAYIDLAHRVGVKMSLKEQGITKQAVDESVDRLAELAYEDNCTVTNPVEPLIADMKQIVLDEYEGTASSDSVK